MKDMKDHMALTIVYPALVITIVLIGYLILAATQP